MSKKTSWVPTLWLQATDKLWMIDRCMEEIHDPALVKPYRRALGTAYENHFRSFFATRLLEVMAKGGMTEQSATQADQSKLDVFMMLGMADAILEAEGYSVPDYSSKEEI